MRRFTLTTSLLGPDRRIELRVYETKGWMRRVVHGLTGDGDDLRIEGAAHLYVLDTDPTDAFAVVYLCRPYLNLTVIAHELHHATLGIYGAFMGDAAVDEYHAGNEALAHMFSDALSATLETLTQEGYDVDGYRPWWEAA